LLQFPLAADALRPPAYEVSGALTRSVTSRIIAPVTSRRNNVFEVPELTDASMQFEPPAREAILLRRKRRQTDVL